MYISGVHLKVVADDFQIAGIYAQDGLDIAKARDSFVRAGEWYKQEDANACVWKRSLIGRKN